MSTQRLLCEQAGRRIKEAVADHRPSVELFECEASALLAELARVREERDRLGAELRRSADRFREFAAHCRKFAWPNLGDEFDGFARDCEAALAASGKEAQHAG